MNVYAVRRLPTRAVMAIFDTPDGAAKFCEGRLSDRTVEMWRVLSVEDFTQPPRSSKTSSA